MDVYKQVTRFNEAADDIYHTIVSNYYDTSGSVAMSDD